MPAVSEPLAGVVLAAGAGTRLAPLTSDRPKVLVEVAGQSLLERLLACCTTTGLRRVVVVTGYRGDAVERWLDAHPSGLDVCAVFNPDWARLGNAQSLYVARAALGEGGFVKLDGDLLLDPDILRRLLDSPWPSAIAVDRQARLDAEAMKARLDDAGRVTALGKWLPVEEASGESIGAEKIAAAAAPRLFEAIERLVDAEGRHDAYYEDVYQRLIEQGWELGAVDTAGGSWTEIDDAADLQRARARLEGVRS
ncbi:MAG: phosphocholine cytidylyltransferase family protein [Deltaproteobacteria bacterium]|nr:phosphocholine cytidylyltransferase family protein [Deltaproteobacteria bacterium]